MIRRSLAALILGPALLIASLSWSGFVALRTVFDPDRSADVAEELFDNEEVQEQLTTNLGVAIETALPDDVPVTDEQIDAIAAFALEDPAVEALILQALDSAHGAFLGEGTAPTTLSLGPVTESLRASLVEAVPQAEGSIPEIEPVEVTLPTDRIPDASPLRSLLQRLVPIGALLAAIGVVVALLTTSDRPTVLRSAGIWAIGAAAFSLVVGLGLPVLIRRFAPDQAEVLAALLAAMLRSVVVPAIALAVGGVVLLVLSAIVASAGSGRSAPAAAPAPVAAPPGGRTEARGVPAGGPVHAAPPPQPQYAPPPVAPPPAAPRRPMPGEPGSSPTTVMPPVPGPAPGWNEPAAPAPSTPAPEPAAGPQLPPRWVEGHGWVMHPQDQGPPPSDATWVAGVGYVLADQSAAPPSDV